ncbi:methionine adenosyltransferase [Clostridium botulinum]|uniref:methionine adenosyltransferase n=1 Tax=Clostridium botulinum TaxID=1491 RepID=UPI001969A3F4|nr:methionine adenosyltransferase [Clostridium botulinum]MBN3410317.1 methionine adenosyltransferase [Clostridium botulinum]MBY6873987.1 methionine adenosyltransferase [Clostridium botulinum]
MKRLFTSESVTEGHPDKICDQISDAVLDVILEKDADGRVACETSITTGMVFVMGEISTKCYIDIPSIVRKTIKEIGYTRAKFGFDCDTCSIITSIDEQSSDIAIGVNESIEGKEGKMDKLEAIGAGDQGMMFGYATNETEEFMPLPISLAHKLSKRLSYVRKNGQLSYLRPDGKTQVTVEYENDKPVKVDSIVVSIQHSPEISNEQIRKDIIENVIKTVVSSELLDKNTKFHINSTGRFVVGGPQGDSGLTGRKIIVDTYGGVGRHGGGAFSGKDPTKVDRSGAYAARWVAKNLVAADIADKLEVQIAYAIGVAEPVSISVDTFKTGKISEDKIVNIINKVFDLRPSSIINDLNLRRPIYRQTAAYGHFGRIDIDLPWEKLNKVEEIKNLLTNDFKEHSALVEVAASLK